MRKLAAKNECVVCGCHIEWSLKDRKQQVCSRVCNSQLVTRTGSYAWWGEAEDELLRKLRAEGLGSKLIAALMGSDANVIRLYSRRYGLPKGDHHLPWSKEDVALLQDLLPFMRYAEIGELMGRTEWAITSKIQYSGIARPPSYYIELGRTFLILPPELREVIVLHNKLKRKLRDEKHSRLEAASVRATRGAKRPSTQA